MGRQRHRLINVQAQACLVNTAGLSPSLRSNTGMKMRNQHVCVLVDVSTATASV